MKTSLLYIFTFFVSSYGVTQEEIPPGARSSVAAHLVQCYNDSIISKRENRPPSTINLLIELIRKLEEPNVDVRQFSYGLLNQFRQDGIRKARSEGDNQFSIPYSPTGWDAYRNRVVQKKLLPYSQNFDLKNLTPVELCTLHFILSKHVEIMQRGDEQYVCNKVSRYTRREKRSDAFEAVELVKTEGSPSTRSDCPVETGGIYTKWGTVYAGSILAGIASGMNSENAPIKNSMQIDTRYGSTLAGDLAEAALYQGREDISIGVNGGWNSTILPKWYFMKKNTFLQVTDSEIRGGIDGLYLALQMSNILAKANNIKVSQILDLYYSPRGVFSNSLRACARNIQQTSWVNTDELKKQSLAFSYLLNEEAVFDKTINPEAFEKLTSLAVDQFNEYFPSLNDVSCATENDTIIRAATDIIIAIDSSWPFKQIQLMLTYLLENLDIHRFGTNYTIINGDGSYIVNTSTSLSEFYQKFNESYYNTLSKTYDYRSVQEKMEHIFKSKLNETSSNILKSTIFLLVPIKTPSEDEKNDAQTKKENYRLYLPNLRVFVLAGNSKTEYANFVTNANSDIFSIDNGNTAEDTIKNVIGQLIDRIKQIPRNIINSKCGTRFENPIVTTVSMVDYVEPQGINYYRIAPNYFYSGEEPRQLKIIGQGFGNLIVCMSRTEPQPKNDTSCKQITSSDTATYDIKDFCSGQSVSDCQPIYISIQATSTLYRCSEYLCRFPDNVKFTISLEHVGCASNAIKFYGSLFLATVLFLVLNY